MLGSGAIGAMQPARYTLRVIDSRDGGHHGRETTEGSDLVEPMSRRPSTCTPVAHRAEKVKVGAGVTRRRPTMEKSAGAR